MVSTPVATPLVVTSPPVANDAPAAPAPGVANVTSNITSTSSDGEFDYQFTLLTNPNYVDPANRTDEDRYMLQTGS